MDDAHRVNFIIEIGCVCVRARPNARQMLANELIIYQKKNQWKKIAEIKMKEILGPNCPNWFRYTLTDDELYNNNKKTKLSQFVYPQINQLKY